ncbi:hypothetical protein SETIT_6G126300v2 [Setaria italica]|uniref:Uncharacterized protein n=1 Tax=Setaria italica TaxID=4555 RepID=K3YNK1_SETIT|nr:hypothetical protein SETIT_6G126300v2 [Setaria italica]
MKAATSPSVLPTGGGAVVAPSSRFHLDSVSSPPRHADSRCPRPRDGSARIHGGLIPSPCMTAPLASCKPHRGRRRVDYGHAAMVDGIWDADLGRSCTARRWLPPSTRRLA